MVSRRRPLSNRGTNIVDLLLSFLIADFLGKPAWLWFSFLGIVLALLAFDLGILHKDDEELGIAESLRLSAFYIAIAVAFGAWIWYSMGTESGMQYFTRSEERRVGKE